jgi:hypothetical protein
MMKHLALVVLVAASLAGRAGSPRHNRGAAAFR